MSFVILKWISMPHIVLVALVVISGIINLIFVPVENKNNPIYEIEEDVKFAVLML